MFCGIPESAKFLHQLFLTGEKSTLQRGRYYFLFIFLQWQVSLLAIAPALYGAMGRFYYEPFKTACTVDFWHRGYKNYPTYIVGLTIFVYVIPLVTMSVQFFTAQTSWPELSLSVDL